MMRTNICSAVLLAGLLSACATTVNLVNGPQVPAAQGVVKVTNGQNGNTRLQLSVKHLAEPDKVSAGAASYVVWVAAAGQDSPPQSLGALVVSKNLTGSLETVTPLRNFTLTITPEPSATAQFPSGMPVLSTKIVRR